MVSHMSMSQAEIRLLEMRLAKAERELTDPTDVSSKAYQFQELMAMMHGDGGHYLARHGAQKAATDAIAKWYAMLRKVEKLEAQILNHHRLITNIALELMK
jgi:hypothetical protein